MIKCEVLKDCALAIKKGSIVLLDERQYEIARSLVKKVELKEEKKETKKK